MTWNLIIIIVYVLLITVYYVFLFLIYFKIMSVTNYKYVYDLNNFIQLFIAVFLLIRYHPFKNKYHLNTSDVYLIFASACFLIINLGVVHYFSEWFWNQYSQFQDISSNPIS